MELKEILEHHILDHVYYTLHLGAVSLPITKHLFMMWLAAGLLLLGVPLIYSSRSPKMRRARSAIEVLVSFIRDGIVISSMGEKGRRFTPYFCTLFFFILMMNLIGLVPYGATATANISVTAALALTTFALINFTGIREHGLVPYIKNFIPHGVPAWLYPLMFPIEIIGLLSKTFALCVRLFANMVGGHMVLLCITCLIFIFAKVNFYVGTFLTIPMEVPMALFISCIELFTAVLQAYIFTFLTAIFTGAALNPH